MSASTIRAICVISSLLAALVCGCFHVETDSAEDVGGSAVDVFTGDDAASSTPDVGPCPSTDDLQHCGRCGNTCTVPPGAAHMVPVCVDGTCQTRCEAGWTDTDGDPSNGCELECSESNDGVEICDNEDNDCDGEVDEEFKTGECSVGRGACRVQGMYACTSETKAECDATPEMPGDETCGDQIDNDCDGEVDEKDAVDAKTWYADGDGDGFGDKGTSKKACTKPMGFVGNREDCDDTDPKRKPRRFYNDADGDGYTKGLPATICHGPTAPMGFAKEASASPDCDDMSAAVHPGAEEVCDGEDTDCDGTKDNIAQTGMRGSTWYADTDGDGHGDPGSPRRACSQPNGFVANDEDCDDNDSSIKPRPFYRDEDGDGYTLGGQKMVCTGRATPTGYSKSKSSPLDCDDSRGSVHPGASEKCDGHDTNCDGTVDNIPQNSTKGTMWYVDCDNDNFSPSATGKLRACGKPSRKRLSTTCNASSADWTSKAPTSRSKTDCHDDNRKVFPGQSEWFPTPIQNPTGNRYLDKWDYNCDRSVDLYWRKQTNCPVTQPGTPRVGWVTGQQVACGDSKDAVGLCYGQFCGGIPACTQPKPTTQRCQ